MIISERDLYIFYISDELISAIFVCPLFCLCIYKFFIFLGQKDGLPFGTNDIVASAAHQIPVHMAPPQTSIYDKLLCFVVIKKLTNLRLHKLATTNEKLYLVIECL